MNEWYLRDLSRKQRTAIRVKGESGKPTTNCVIYGYKTDPQERGPLAHMSLMSSFRRCVFSQPPLFTV